MIGNIRYRPLPIHRPIGSLTPTITMTRTNTYHSVEGYISRETDKAILIDVHKIAGEELYDGHENRKKHWFPISQVAKITRQPKGSLELDCLMASEWILRQKEMI